MHADRIAFAYDQEIGCFRLTLFDLDGNAIFVGTADVASAILGARTVLDDSRQINDCHRSSRMRR